jgi:hypothetical protein
MAKSSNSTKNLKQTISESPLAIIVGIVIGTVSVSAGVYEYFARQRISAIEDSTKQRIGTIEDSTKQQISSIEGNTKRRIENLELDHARDLYAANIRMSSIERRIASSSGEKFIDVASIPITARLVPSLDNSYRAVGRNEVYVNVVDDVSWTFSEANELEMLTLGLGGDKLLEVSKQLEDGKLGAELGALREVLNILKKSKSLSLEKYKIP